MPGENTPDLDKAWLCTVKIWYAKSVASQAW